MEITKFGHACIRLTSASEGVGDIVIDPGTMSDAPTALKDATFVLITHDHFDHLDVAAITTAMSAPNSQIKVFANQSAADILLAAGASPSNISIVAPGDRPIIPGWQVMVGGGWHAPIHSSLPRARNVTYTISADGESVYHPGDSFDLPNAPVDLSCVPVSGPWLKLGEAIDYLHAGEARLAIPIHDAMNSDAGNRLVDGRLSDPALIGSTKYQRLASGECLEI